MAQGSDAHTSREHPTACAECVTHSHGHGAIKLGTTNARQCGTPRARAFGHVASIARGRV
eukprot:8865553-Lingulodinium_polyedra.AAC.1